MSANMMRTWRFVIFVLAVIISALNCFAQDQPAVQSDIIFVTQIPIPSDVTNVASAFGNHEASVEDAPRGGDLYIRYRDGTLRNLTQAAGLGMDGLQAERAIAVRDPCMHWDGNKVLFSMVVGSPGKSGHATYAWQLYELAGLGKSDIPAVTKVAGQTAAYNNVMPAYGSDDRIFFVSDRPHNSDPALFPQHDEGTSAPSNSGIWRLDPATGTVSLLDHAPSGAFKPFVDSFGRLLFTRWDHLQRDELADDTKQNGAFNFSTENANSPRLNSKLEIFPEPRALSRKIPNLNLHTFDRFSPWQINQDGTELETINHIGRHELQSTFLRSFTDDPNLSDFVVPQTAANQQRITNFFQIREDPVSAGMLFGVDAPELASHGAGQLIAMTAAPNSTADAMVVRYVTGPETKQISENPNPAHTGLYRDPLPLSDGTLIAAHTDFTGFDENAGSARSPKSLYAFRLQTIVQRDQYAGAGVFLTPGIEKTISYYDPPNVMHYSGLLWELQPVEVRAVPRPPLTRTTLALPEQRAFQEAGVDVNDFQNYLVRRNLGVIVSRNLTTRDAADRQQPFNLQVAGTTTTTVGSAGKMYEVKYLQILEGELLRGYGSRTFPLPGRRVLAQPLHDSSFNNPVTEGPAGAVALGDDGSMAALVPAARALSWQLMDRNHNAVVRERYWLTVQPGEVRLCTSCHGVNTYDQANHAEPANIPQALVSLLQFWRSGAAEKGTTAFTLTASHEPQFAKRASAFREHEHLTLTATGNNAASASRAADIYLRVGNKRCQGPVGHVITDGSGIATLSGYLPRQRGISSLSGIPLTLLLKFEGTPVSSTTIRLFTRHPKHKPPTPNPANLNTICRAFNQFQ